jgi:hypothetical protein
LGAVLALLWHFARIVAGYGLAVAAAAGLMAAALRPFGPGLDGEVLAAGLVGWAALVSIFIGGFAALPTLVVVAAAEIFRLSEPIYFILCGGAMGAVAGLAGFVEIPRPELPEAASPAAAASSFFVAATAAGFVAGAVYWLVAGRRSGAWRGLIERG